MKVQRDVWKPHVMPRDLLHFATLLPNPFVGPVTIAQLPVVRTSMAPAVSRHKTKLDILNANLTMKMLMKAQAIPKIQSAVGIVAVFPVRR